MITFFHIHNIETKAYPPQEELNHVSGCKINCDIGMKNITLLQDTKSLRIEFHIALVYLEPSIGRIRFEGIVHYTGEGNLTSIKKEWDAGRAPINIQNEVANFAMSNCAPLALLLSRATKLPPAIPIPLISFGVPEQVVEKKEQNIYA